MPIAVLASAPTDPSQRPVPSANAPRAPGRGGFDAALATVTLSQMVEYAATGTLQGAPPGGAPVSAVGIGAVGGVTGVGTDAWGRSADRPRSSATGAGTKVLAAGERYLGVPYKWGGTSASTGFDCSGFVQRVYADVGIRLPRVSIDQSKQGVAVANLDQARAGDLVFWNGSGSRPNHIGIYAGEGRMLVAPRTGDVVRYQEITRTPHGIRRVLP